MCVCVCVCMCVCVCACQSIKPELEGSRFSHSVPAYLMPALYLVPTYLLPSGLVPAVNPILPRPPSSHPLSDDGAILHLAAVQVHPCFPRLPPPPLLLVLSHGLPSYSRLSLTPRPSW